MMATAYDALFRASAVKWDVPEWLLEGLARTESSLNPKAYRAEPKTNDGSYGLMQLLTRTARGLGYAGTPDGLYDPALNIDLGAKLSSQIIRRQGGLNLADFYSEYNSGRAALWRTSSQVAKHVANFLRNVARVLGVELPAGYSIEDALAVLKAVSTSSMAPLLVILGFVLLARR